MGWCLLGGRRKAGQLGQQMPLAPGSRDWTSEEDLVLRHLSWPCPHVGKEQGRPQGPFTG